MFLIYNLILKDLEHAIKCAIARDPVFIHNTVRCSFYIDIYFLLGYIGEGVASTVPYNSFSTILICRVTASPIQYFRLSCAIDITVIYYYSDIRWREKNLLY